MFAPTRVFWQPDYIVAYFPAAGKKNALPGAGQRIVSSFRQTVGVVILPADGVLRHRVAGGGLGGGRFLV